MDEGQSGLPANNQTQDRDRIKKTFYYVNCAPEALHQHGMQISSHRLDARMAPSHAHLSSLTAHRSSSTACRVFSSVLLLARCHLLLRGDIQRRLPTWRLRDNRKTTKKRL
ncbi:hypothetical protein J6590_023682 [Homalodisca vitripennis]|nr:hypothetical protein J6590_023682 [Homalodisca vitripennis]